MFAIAGIGASPSAPPSSLLCHSCHSHWLYAAIKLKILNIIVSEKLAPSCPAAVEQTVWEGGGEDLLTCALAQLACARNAAGHILLTPAPRTSFPAADNIAGIAGTQSQSRKPKAIYAHSYSSLSVFCELRKDNAYWYCSCCLFCFCSHFSHLIVWIFTEFKVLNCRGSGKFVEQKVCATMMYIRYIKILYSIYINKYI